jgi:signal peptidase I
MPGFAFLSTPEDSFLVPKKSYFALGDNSYHSSDSRAWGAVPEANVSGRGLIVYWPFSSRWGIIR